MNQQFQNQHWQNQGAQYNQNQNWQAQTQYVQQSGQIPSQVSAQGAQYNQNQQWQAQPQLGNNSIHFQNTHMPNQFQQMQNTNTNQFQPNTAVNQFQVAQQFQAQPNTAQSNIAQPNTPINNVNMQYNKRKRQAKKFHSFEHAYWNYEKHLVSNLCFNQIEGKRLFRIGNDCFSTQFIILGEDEMIHYDMDYDKVMKRFDPIEDDHLLKGGDILEEWNKMFLIHSNESKGYRLSSRDLLTGELKTLSIKQQHSNLYNTDDIETAIAMKILKQNAMRSLLSFSRYRDKYHPAFQLIDLNCAEVFCNVQLPIDNDEAQWICGDPFCYDLFYCSSEKGNCVYGFDFRAPDWPINKWEDDSMKQPQNLVLPSFPGRQFAVMSGESDSTINIFDLAMPKKPIRTLKSLASIEQNKAKETTDNDSDNEDSLKSKRKKKPITSTVSRKERKALDFVNNLLVFASGKTAEIWDLSRIHIDMSPNFTLRYTPQLSTPSSATPSATAPTTSFSYTRKPKKSSVLNNCDNINFTDALILPKHHSIALLSDQLSSVSRISGFDSSIVYI